MGSKQWSQGIDRQVAIDHVVWWADNKWQRLTYLNMKADFQNNDVDDDDPSLFLNPVL